MGCLSPEPGKGPAVTVPCLPFKWRRTEGLFRGPILNLSSAAPGMGLGKGLLVGPQSPVVGHGYGGSPAAVAMEVR